MGITFNGIDQSCLLEGITSSETVDIRFVLDAAYEDFTGINRYILDAREVGGTGYFGTYANNSSVFNSGAFLKVDGVSKSSLDSTIGALGVELGLAITSAANDGTINLFSKNDDTEFVKISTSKIEVWNDARTTLFHSFDLSAPASSTINDTVGSATLTLVGFTFGVTVTGPDITTEGSATVATGTDLDTVTTFSLISGSNSVVQTIDSATATTLNYVARSGVSLCTPSTPVAGLPLEPTISAAGITPYVVQQEAE